MVLLHAELDEFMMVLEQRFSKKQKKAPLGLVAKKVRKIGSPSESPPPFGAPLWAVKKEFQVSGMYRNL